MMIIKEPTAKFQYAFVYPFDYGTLAVCRKIKDRVGGGAFNFYANYWRFNDLSIIDIIKQYYPETAIDASLQTDMEKFLLAKKQLELQVRVAEELKHATDTNFLVKNIKGELYPYQKIGVQFLINNNGKAILADQMGTGKTVQSLAYVTHNKLKKTLVVCPASVKGAWRNEVKKWTKLKSYVLNTHTELTLDVINEYDIFIINYDIQHKFMDVLTTARFDCLIIDECQYIKSSDARRTKCTKLIGKKIPSIVLLSGTPLLNRPRELFNSLNLIDPISWPDYYFFSRRYCNGHQGRWGWDDKGASNINELQQKISRYFLRRTKENVLKELPPKTYIDMPVELENGERAKYKFAEDSFIEYLREVKDKTNEEIRRSLSAEKLTKLNELRMITSMGKIAAAIETIENIVESGEKVVVFSVYNEPLNQMKAHFGEQAVMLTGKTDTDERTNVINKFQTDENCKIFLGGMRSAGIGITLTAAANVLLLDFPWVPADREQAIDRIHRPGQMASHATIYQLIAENTIDSKMQKILASKQEIFDQLIEGKVPEKQQTSMVKDLLKSFSKKGKE